MDRYVNNMNRREEKIQFYRAMIEQMKNPRTYTERAMLQVYKDMLKKHEVA